MSILAGKLPLLIIAGLLHWSSSLCDDQLVEEFFLNKKSFFIWSQIAVKEDTLDRLVTFQENYSYDQKRAKLNYHASEMKLKMDASKENSYTYDAIGGDGVLYQKEYSKCFKVNLDSLYEYLFSQCNLPRLLSIIELNKDFDHIVGPSRLLFLVNQRWDKLDTIPQKTSDGFRIRDNPAIGYKLQVETSDSQKFVLEIFYNSKSHKFDTQKFTQSIPLQIVVHPDSLNSNNSMIINYLTSHISSSSGLRSKSLFIGNDLTNRIDIERAIDSFSIPVLAECPPDMELVKKHDEFEKLVAMLETPITNIKFSFNVKDSTRAMYSDEGPKRHFVAFDGSTLSLRVDSWTSDRGYEIDSVKSIFDLRLNRRYYTSRGRQTRSISFDDVHCTVTEAVHPNLLINFKRSFTLKKLLWGDRDQFDYRGRAQVGDVMANVFEVTDSRIPFWFELPFFYQNKDGIVEMDGDGFYISRDSIPITNLVYFSAEDTPRLLLLEVYRKTGGSLNRPLLRLSLNNFIWDLSESPDGDKASKLFSLRDECSRKDINNPETYRYAEISLLLAEEQENGLQHEKRPINHWLFNPLVRNEVLLSDLTHRFSTSLAMVFDFSSKIVTDNSYMKEIGELTSISVHFSVAEQANILHTIKFIGFGQLENQDDNNLITTYVLSLFDCLMKFSHPEKAVYVLFFEDELERTCTFSINSTFDPLDVVLEKEETKLFKVRSDKGKSPSRSRQDDKRIYWVLPMQDNDLYMTNSWFEKYTFNRIENELVSLKNEVQEFERDNQVNLRVRKVNIKQSDRENQLPDKVSVVRGFGFELDESSNTRRVTDDTGTRVDVADRQHCQNVCLADLNCKSFSFCLKNLKPECLLSSISIIGNEVMKVLKSKGYTPREKKINLRLDNDENIILIRNLKCEIENKEYLRLFSDNYDMRRFVTGIDKLVKVHDGPEVCAKYCFNTSLSIIDSSLKFARQIQETFVNLSGLEDGQDRQEVDESRHMHKKIFDSFCHSFDYIDASILDHKQLLALSNMANISGEIPYEDEAKFQSTGFCILPYQYTGSENSSIDLYLQNIPAKRYRFDYLTLYQKNQGLRLEGTSLDHNLVLDLLDVSAGRQVSGESLELIRRTVAEKKNLQYSLNQDDMECARRCILQDSGLWPSCRSFDIVHLHENSESAAKRYCVLNTMSIDEVINQTNAIAYSDGMRKQFWHYEPKFGFAKEEGAILEKIRTLSSQIHQSNGFHLGLLSVIMITISSLVSGFLLGMIATRKFFPKTNDTTYGPTYDMNTLISKLDK